METEGGNGYCYSILLHKYLGANGGVLYQIFKDTQFSCNNDIFMENAVFQKCTVINYT